ncbi:MAG TPA: Maf family protein [Candidatus Cybelea sp.]
MTRIILGSESPRRLELLQSLGLVVEVVRSGYEEPPLGHLAPADLAANHARAKLDSVLNRLAGRFDAPVLTADTVVDLDGVALGKPRDAAEAAQMLTALSGREHAVHTAFALALPERGAAVQERVTTRVRFYPLEPGEIAEYVATGEPFDKAGAYGIQGRAAFLVEAIDGDFYTVMGLPLARVVRSLRRLGFRLPAPK